MISRLTAVATTFALLTTTLLGFAAQAHQGSTSRASVSTSTAQTSSAGSSPTRIVQLPTVTVIGKRSPVTAQPEI